MPEYKLTFVVEGKDRASGQLGSVGGALGRVAEFALGDLLAGGIRRIGEAILSLGKNAIGAVGHAQNLELGLEGLLTESLMYQKVIDVQQVAIQLTAQETKKLASLQIQREKLTAAIQLQEVNLAEAARKKNESEEHYLARMAKMQATLDTNKQKLGQYNAEIASLQGKQGRLADVTEQSWKQMMSFDEASGMAKDQAQGLLAFVEKLAITSPFETEQVEEVARIGVSAKMSADKVQEFTQAFLDYSAVHGITSSNLSFAADQFLQLRKAGTLTAIDLRQLRRLGIDVEQVLGVKMGMSVADFNEQVKKSPGLMDELFDSFIEMAGEGTAGAAQRMSMTVDGMMSTARDIVDLGSRKLFRPIVEAVSPFAADLIGQISDVITGGQLEQIGAQMGEFLTAEVVPRLAELWTWLQENVPLAIQTVSDYWTGTLQPALEQVWGYVQTNVLPVLLDLWNWLQVNLPIAIAALSEFWVNTLQPALEQVWTFVQTNIIPILASVGAMILAVVVPAFVTWAAGAISAAVATITALAPVVLPILAIGAAVGLLVAAWQQDWGGIRTTLTRYWNDTLKPIFDQLRAWLAEHLPVAIDALVAFWNDTLMPALEAAWAWINEYLVPLLEALGEVIGATLVKAGEALTGIWQNVLLPALTDLWTWINDKVLPVVQDLWSWLSEKLSPAFDGVSNAIQAATGWLKDLASKIANLKLPDWMTPGSPTPWEMGLRGVSAALSELTRAQFPQLEASLAISPVGPGAAMGGPGAAGMVGGGGATVNHYHLTVNSAQRSGGIVMDFATMAVMGG